MIELIKYLLCTAGGVAIGYYLAHGRLEQEFEKRLEMEALELKYHYRDFYKKKSAEAGEDKGLTDAAVSAAESLSESLGYSVGPDILTQELTATVERAAERGDLDVEPPADDAWDRDKKAHEAEKEEAPEPPRTSVREQLIQRAETPKVNYNRISTPEKVEEKTEAVKAAEAAEDEADVRVESITKQAFIEDQFGYKQFSFTYFAGDDMLANEEDEPVTGAARVASLGSDALEKLKVGRQAMGGENTIYVRNHTGHWEFEVTRSDGKMSDEVDAKSG